jgi:uncharacterized repeat protein (TIGR01451 family)
MAPQRYTVSGTVWSDINKDGTRQNSELGMPGVNVVLYGFVFGNPDSMVCESVATDANGFYQFTLLSGDYQLIESANESVPIDSATCPPAESDPTGYMSTTPNTRNFTIYQANLERQDFGDYVGFTLSGQVFDDNGAGGGTSGNQTKDGTESGISGVTIVASDGNGTEYATAITATDGTYSMVIPGSATDVVVTESNPSGYASVGGSAGSTSGSYTLASDSISFTTTGDQVYSGLDFADIQKPTLAPDNAGTVLPGNFVNYPHRFTTPVAGTVVFSSVSDLSPTPGWASTVYEDANCDGLLDPGESIIAGQSVTVAANETICLINKVNSPGAAFAQESNRATITATFEDASGATSSVLTVKDITTVTTGDASTLVIRKSVQNMTQGTPATETSNAAKPGDELRYRITYRNTGNAGITDVVIKDVVPVFTTYVAGSASCDSTPAGMGCTPTVTGNDIDWTITNELPGFESGQVSYEVTVDN